MIDKLLSKFGYVKKAGPIRLRDDERIYRSLRELINNSTSGVTQPYKQSVWVYASINAIAGNISRVPFRIYKSRPSNREPRVLETGPLYEVFTNPNPMMTQEILFSALMIFLSLYGEAFLILERNNVSEIPTEMWTFNPTRFEPIIDEKSGILVGWYYLKGTKNEITFPASQVIQIKYYNPYDDVRGLSPLDAAQTSIDQDYHAGQYNLNFFKDGCEVGGILSTEAELTDEQYSRILKQFENRHKGSGKAHRVALVEGGAKFVEAKITQKDMEFIEGKRMTRLEILAAYKVNEVVLGFYDNTKSYEGIKSAHKAFWEECLMPKITYIEGILWSKLFSKIEGGKVYGAFDLANVGPLQVNYSEKIDTAMKMFHMGWPINQINQRLQLGMTDVPWGDEWWVPGGFLPVTSIQAGGGTSEPSAPSEETVPVKEISYTPFHSEYKSKITRFLFDARKAHLEISYGNKDKIELDKIFGRLERSLSNVYQQSISTGVFSVQKDVGEVIPEMEIQRLSSSYISARVTCVVNGFKNLLGSVSVSASPEQIREAYNLLSNKATELSKQEMDVSVKFGEKLATDYVKRIVNTVLIEKEERHDENH